MHFAQIHYGDVRSRFKQGNQEPLIALFLLVDIHLYTSSRVGKKGRKGMQDSTTDTRFHTSHTLLRLGFVLLLLLSPLLPYGITIAYDSHLMAKLPARLEALPLYPNATLGRKIIKRDMENNQCLILILQYNKHNAPQKSVDEFYEAKLLEAGWHSTGGTNPYSHRYHKSSMTLRIYEFTPKSYRLYITFDILPIFEPRCLP